MDVGDDKEKMSKMVVHPQAAVVRLAVLHEMQADARLQLGTELSPELGLQAAREMMR